MIGVSIEAESSDLATGPASVDDTADTAGRIDGFTEMTGDVGACDVSRGRATVSGAVVAASSGERVAHADTLNMAQEATK